MPFCNLFPAPQREVSLKRLQYGKSVYHSLKSPVYSSVSITVSVPSFTRITDCYWPICASSGGVFGLGDVSVARFGLLGIATPVFLFNIQSQQAGNVHLYACRRRRCHLGPHGLI